jgi:hypothetical protein
LFLGAGTFRERVERIAGAFADDALVARVIAFIRAGGTRPLSMAAADRGGGADAAVADP